MEDFAVHGRPGPGRRESRERDGEKHGAPARSLDEISKTVWLTPENAVFSSRNGLLWLTLDGKETRVILCREFPFDCLWEYISVLDEEHRELGIIRSTGLFAGETRELLENELRRRYYAPEVLRILSVKERYGFSYWKVQTPEGEVRFTLHDTYRSIQRVDAGRIVFSDVNGNRFEIPDVGKLDAKSQRRLELYL
mgnify:FL=1